MGSKISLVALGEPRWSKAVLFGLELELIPAKTGYETNFNSSPNIKWNYGKIRML